MRALFLIATLMTVSNVFAQTSASNSNKDILICTFANPNFEVRYDAETGVVTYSDTVNYDEPDYQVTVVATNARLREENGVLGVYSLVNAQDQVIMALHLGKGRDGKTDNIYPFSAEYKGSIGGCDTVKVSAYSARSLIDGLKR